MTLLSDRFGKTGEKKDDEEAEDYRGDTLDNKQPLPRRVPVNAVEVLLHAVGDQAAGEACEGSRAVQDTCGVEHSISSSSRCEEASTAAVRRPDLPLRNASSSGLYQ